MFYLGWDFPDPANCGEGHTYIPIVDNVVWSSHTDLILDDESANSAEITVPARTLPGKYFVKVTDTDPSHSPDYDGLTVWTDSRDMVVTIGIDMDVDLDNDGIFSGTGDENAETNGCGLLILVNDDDDDNANGIDKTNSIIDGNSDTNDMKILKLRQMNYDLVDAVITLSVSDSSKVRIFDTNNIARIGPSSAASYSIPLSDIMADDLNCLVEGVSGGEITITLSCHTASGILLCHDEITVTVVDITPFRVRDKNNTANSVISTGIYTPDLYVDETSASDARSYKAVLP